MSDSARRSGWSFNSAREGMGAATTGGMVFAGETQRQINELAHNLQVNLLLRSSKDVALIKPIFSILKLEWVGQAKWVREDEEEKRWCGKDPTR